MSEREEKFERMMQAVLETKRDACEGLSKAAFFAKDNHISLGRMIAEY